MKNNYKYSWTSKYPISLESNLAKKILAKFDKYQSKLNYRLKNRIDIQQFLIIALLYIKKYLKRINHQVKLFGLEINGS